MRRRSAVVLGAILWLSGCAESLPRHAWRGPEHAMEILAARAQGTGNVTAVGRATFSDRRGRSPALDAAIALRPPDHLRLRGWKFQNPVLDLTLNDQGLFIWTAERAANEGALSLREFDTRHLSAAWAMVRGDLFTEPPSAIELDGRHLKVTFLTSSMRITALVDRPTLTVRRYILEPLDGKPEPGLIELDAYAMIEGEPWPMRLVLKSPGRTLDIRLDEVDLDADLPENAFVPPRRAVRQP